MSCCPSQILKMNGKAAALTLFRLYFGIWLLYAGVTKWVMFGPEGFINYLISDFSKTWITPPLLHGTGWVIMIAEPLLGLWLLVGCAKRQAWVLTSLLLFMLTFGKTVQMDFAVVSANWNYLFFTLVALALTDDTSAAKEGCCGAS